MAEPLFISQLIARIVNGESFRSPGFAQPHQEQAEPVEAILETGRRNGPAARLRQPGGLETGQAVKMRPEHQIERPSRGSRRGREPSSLREGGQCGASPRRTTQGRVFREEKAKRRVGFEQLESLRSALGRAVEVQGSRHAV